MISLDSKFKGCLLGGMVGDCIGNVFEFVDARVIHKELDRKIHEIYCGKVQYPVHYTDDTVMAIEIGNSLVQHKYFKPVDIAHRFAVQYQSDMINRNYGAHVQTVLVDLLSCDEQNVYQPAQKQFNGSGSYGNGAAMRIGPTALFTFRYQPAEAMEVIDGTSKLTHSHPAGIVGARLLAWAIHQALAVDPVDAKVPVNFPIEFLAKLRTMHHAHNSSYSHCAALYTQKLDKIEEFLKNNSATTADVAHNLGCGVAALESVPTAIYCYLSQMAKPAPFEETIKFAIRLGGDTDTIACMAGYLSGAHFGAESVPEKLATRCENHEHVAELGQKLYETVKQN